MLQPSYPLETARLLLRPYEAADLDALHAMHSREDVTRYLLWGPRTRDQSRALLERRMSRRTIEEDDGDGLVLAVVLRGTGAVVGEVALALRSREHLQGEVGFVLHPDHQGRGYATEAVGPLLRLAFEDLGLHHVVARCDPRNGPSIRVMERLGMRQEALLRETELVKDEWCDELVCGLLDREWRARRDNVEGWTR